MIQIRYAVATKVPKPKIVGDSIIVKGNFTNLIAQNCTNVEWKFREIGIKNFSNIPNNSDTISVNPNHSTEYSARCLAENCHGDWSNFSLKVRPKKPEIYASADTICADGSTTILAHTSTSSVTGCEDGTLKWLNDSRLGGLLLSIAPKKDTTYSSICVGIDGLVSDTSKVRIVGKK